MRPRVKNYPNQASTFSRIRRTLAVIRDLNDQAKDASSSDVLGYACAIAGVYTFRYLDVTTATDAEVRDRIAEERQKPIADQGALTFARELRRTLRDMGWIDVNATVTEKGQQLLGSQPTTADEQGLLVEGLLSIEATHKGDVSPHHPVATMLRLLAESESHHRDGLELALEPEDDSDAEFRRVRAMYRLPREQRIAALGISNFQRANAVKVFPTLAVAAGLVVEDGDGYFSLSQEGWNIIGQAASPTMTKKAIAKRGRRTTVGKLVTSTTIAKRRATRPPRTLSPQEQARAAHKLAERTAGHQALVSRMAERIGDGHGEFFEDPFSYDMLWVPHDTLRAAILFEMKTVTDEADAHARVRHAVGQLSYYEYFHAAPRLEGRSILRCAVFDAEVPAELRDYLTHELVAAVVLAVGAPAEGLNQQGLTVLELIAPKPAAA